MRTNSPPKSKFQLKFLVVALLLLILPASSFAGVFVSITVAPPPLPVYSQPLCPGPGYIWTPGYWAYGDDGGYYWVPGTWVMAPFVGGLWTPGYWGWGDGIYRWHSGYWGTEVGFYGGVNYGYGYGGRGYDGGYWRGRDFNYNRYVNNVDPVRVHNVYEKTVINNVNITRVSYNGGQGGVTAAPTPQEQNAYRAKRADALPVQQQHVHAAASNRALYASVNRGNPAIAATPRPGAFNDRGAVPANHAVPITNANNVQPLHGTPQNNAQQPAPARNDAVNNHPQRNANPGGTGTAPLITAHPINNQPPASGTRTPQPGYNNQQQNHPQYNAEKSNNPHPQYSAPQPQQHPQSVQSQQQQRAEAPQHSQNARPETQQAPKPQAHYNAPSQPQQHMSAPSQQHVQAAPQQQHMSAPPQQHVQAAPPQQQHTSAPPQQQPHPQAAPHQEQHGGAQTHDNSQHDH
jgi:WXXGXW repeat (2 copies)